MTQVRQFGVPAKLAAMPLVSSKLDLRWWPSAARPVALGDI